MAEGDWTNGGRKMLTILLSGEAGLTHLTERGEKETDDTFLLILNASHEPADQHLPAAGDGLHWQVLIDTARDDDAVDDELFAPGYEIGVDARTAMLLVARPAE